MEVKIRWICRMFLPVLLHRLICMGADGIARGMIRGAGPVWAGGAAAVAAALICIPVMLRLEQFYKKEMKAAPAYKGGVILLLISMMAGLCCSFIGNSLIIWIGNVWKIAADAGQEGLKAMPLFLRLPGLCLITPAAEELVFRALFYEQGKQILPRGAALLLTAAVFAAGHGAGLQTGYAFLMSLLLSVFYDKAGLPACILCHAGANLAVLLAGM